VSIPTPKVGYLKPLSRSMSVTLPLGSGTVDNLSLVADQPTGGLRNFLLASYESDDAVEDAFASGGGSLVVRCTFGREPRVVRFTRDDAGRPTLHLADAAPTSTVELRLLLAEAVRA